jgi:mono/diheme cytochrome c family protein
VNRHEKEQYLREYEVMKKKGKPFFPYAVMKDSVMMLIVVLVIAAMSIWLGAEQGPKADPTTTTYVPRPEWYFFFLFELLRVIKPPALVPIATIGVPTIAMVLLLLLPFYDRGPERNPLKRPLAAIAGILTIVAMATLTFLGAEAGNPTDIELATAQEYEAGKAVVEQSGCTACHKFGTTGGTLGPNLTEVGLRLPEAAIARSLEVGPGIMPSYAGLEQQDPEKFADLLSYLGSLNGEN